MKFEWNEKFFSSILSRYYLNWQKKSIITARNKTTFIDVVLAERESCNSSHLDMKEV